MSVTISDVGRVDVCNAGEVWAYLDAAYTGAQPPLRLRISRAEALDLIRRARDDGRRLSGSLESVGPGRDRLIILPVGGSLE